MSQENNGKLTDAQESDNLLKLNNDLSGILSSSQETLKHASERKKIIRDSKEIQLENSTEIKTTSIMNLNETQITKGKSDYIFLRLM